MALCKLRSDEFSKEYSHRITIILEEIKDRRSSNDRPRR
jgi:hypothetical protein